MARSTRRPALRGIVTRLFAALLGAAIALAIMIAMQAPFFGEAATIRVSLSSLAPATSIATPLDWPTVGSAALVIPSLGVLDAWHDEVVPIASLTKMMTAFVTLRRLPLAVGSEGPCVTVSDNDVYTYDEMKMSAQSSVPVFAGESVCELQLLQGLLVHSANNYALLLADMVAGSPVAFTALMNQTARSLGLAHTYYEEPTGYLNGSVSTALEQGELAARLMASALVRSIVILPSVDLPFAGVENTFTPYIGEDNVIGVKSGRTAAAGGCDVMAMTFLEGDQTRVLYSVVLGQQGGDLLGPAGDAALALAQSAVANETAQSYPGGTRFGTIGWGRDVTPFALAATHTLYWFAATQHLGAVIRMRRFTTPIRRHEVVGWLVVRGTSTHLFALTAQRAVSPPTVWQRLR